MGWQTKALVTLALCGTFYAQLASSLPATPVRIDGLVLGRRQATTTGKNCTELFDGYAKGNVTAQDVVEWGALGCNATYPDVHNFTATTTTSSSSSSASASSSTAAVSSSSSTSDSSSTTAAASSTTASSISVSPNATASSTSASPNATEAAGLAVSAPAALLTNGTADNATLATPKTASVVTNCGASSQCKGLGGYCFACRSGGWNCGSSPSSACNDPTARTAEGTTVGHSQCGASSQCPSGQKCYQCPVGGWNCGVQGSVACDGQAVYLYAEGSDLDHSLCGSSSSCPANQKCWRCSSKGWNCGTSSGYACDEFAVGTAENTNDRSRSQCGSSSQCAYGQKCWSCASGGWNCGSTGLIACGVATYTYAEGSVAPPPPPSGPTAHTLCGSSSSCPANQKCWKCSQNGWNCGTSSGYACDEFSVGTAENNNDKTRSQCGASSQCAYGQKCWSCAQGGWNCGSTGLIACGVATYNYAEGSVPPPTTTTSAYSSPTAAAPHTLCGSSSSCPAGQKCWTCGFGGYNCGSSAGYACDQFGVGTTEDANDRTHSNCGASNQCAFGQKCWSCAQGGWNCGSTGLIACGVDTYVYAEGSVAPPTTTTTAPPPATGGPAGGSAAGAVIYSCKQNGQYALTFDDGPAASTQSIKDILIAKGVVATFFVNGNNFANINDYKALLLDSLSRGYQIGMHGWSHCDLATPQCIFSTEIDQLETTVTALIGKRPTYWRPAYGSYNAAAQSYLQNKGYRIVLWGPDTLDYTDTHIADPNLSLQVIQDALNSQSSSSYSTISLSHDVHPTTANYVGAAIDFIRSKGYQLVTVAQCDGDPSGGYV